MIFVSDIHRFVPIQISKVSGDINLFKLRGTLNPDLLLLGKNYIWDILDINWSQIKILINNKKK